MSRLSTHALRIITNPIWPTVPENGWVTITELTNSNRQRFPYFTITEKNQLDGLHELVDAGLLRWQRARCPTRVGKVPALETAHFEIITQAACAEPDEGMCYTITEEERALFFVRHPHELEDYR